MHQVCREVLFLCNWAHCFMPTPNNAIILLKKASLVKGCNTTKAYSSTQPDEWCVGYACHKGGHADALKCDLWVFSHIAITITADFAPDLMSIRPAILSSIYI